MINFLTCSVRIYVQNVTLFPTVTKEVMNNFLTRPVRIQVQNNQNKSRDSPPCVSELLLVFPLVLKTEVFVPCPTIRFLELRSRLRITYVLVGP